MDPVFLLIVERNLRHGSLILSPSAAAQTHFIIDKIEGALQCLGVRLEDVVRTRIYIQNKDEWEPVARMALPI